MVVDSFVAIDVHVTEFDRIVLVEVRSHNHCGSHFYVDVFSMDNPPSEILDACAGHDFTG